MHGKLLEQEWHVLHFIGHGAYDTDTDEGVLAFVGRDGRADNVPATALADLLDEAEPTPRLVVLNSCQSGAGGTIDLFSGTAAALAHSGIHAVAAMQFSISDSAAIAFARGFYTALAHGRGIDEAVRSGRIGILGIARGTLEWVTPVLYLRGEDTRLFDVAPLVERAPPPPAPPVTPPVTPPVEPPAEEEPDVVSTEAHPERPPAEPPGDGGPIEAPTDGTPPPGASDAPPTPPPRNGGRLGRSRRPAPAAVAPPTLAGRGHRVGRHHRRWDHGGARAPAAADHWRRRARDHGSGHGSQPSRSP